MLGIYLVEMAADSSLPVLAEMVVLDLLIVLDRLVIVLISSALSTDILILVTCHCSGIKSSRDAGTECAASQ